MTSFEWLEYLRMYDFDVLESNEHIVEAGRLFRRFGHALPFSALLTDHEELSNALAEVSMALEPGLD